MRCSLLLQSSISDSIAHVSSQHMRLVCVAAAFLLQPSKSAYLGTFPTMSDLAQDCPSPHRLLVIGSNLVPLDPKMQINTVSCSVTSKEECKRPGWFVIEDTSEPVGIASDVIDRFDIQLPQYHNVTIETLPELSRDMNSTLLGPWVCSRINSYNTKEATTSKEAFHEDF